MYEIVRVEVSLFRKGLHVRGVSQMKRYQKPGFTETWWPSASGPELDVIGPDEVIFKQDNVLIRVTPISEVADGVFDGDLAFRMTTNNVFSVMGQSLRKFVEDAWNRFYKEEAETPNLDWRAYAFIALFETMDEKPDTTPPTFRGYIPMDERLLTVCISQDWFQK